MVVKMRIITGKETCCVCRKPAIYLFGSAPPETPGYFNHQWYCKDHFHQFTTTLKEWDDEDKKRGEKAEFQIINEGEQR
jgi:hypothetical protein